MWLNGKGPFVGPGRRRTLGWTPQKRQGHQQRGRCAVGRGGVITEGRAPAKADRGKMGVSLNGEGS